MNFGEKLAVLRKEKDWSQGELAENIGVHKTLIGKYERSESIPTIETAKKVADIFQVSLDYLVDTKGDESAFKDKEIVSRIAEIERLPQEEKGKLYFLIDAVVRDYKTRTAYSK